MVGQRSRSNSEEIMQEVMEEEATDGLPQFLDLEASSLRFGVSYPTEVAWSDEAGHIYSYLIKPDPRWTDWSRSAEAITGLSRKQLFREGHPVHLVATTMNHQLAGRVLYCDGGAHDAFWLRRLFEAAGTPCRFLLEDISRMVPSTVMGWPDWPAHLQGLIRDSRLAAGQAHRAAPDVAYLRELYRRVRESLEQMTDPTLTSYSPRRAQLR
jgi:hypothetical protein